MEFNPSKCQVLHVTRNKRKMVRNKYFLHGHELESVSSAKYLGVDLTSDLSWNNNISRITATANRTLGFIKRNITTSNTNIKTVAYQTLVRPQLENSSTVWHPHTKSNTHKLEMVQCRAIRWVVGDYSPLSSVTAMQDRLGWRSLEQRRIDARIVMFFKIYHQLVAVNFPDYICTPLRYTRQMHCFSLRQVQVTSDYQKFAFFPHTVVLWNSLPGHIVSITDLDKFKSAVANIIH